MVTRTRCSGCEDREVNTDFGCCKLVPDHDGLPARCVGDWTVDKHYYLRRYCDIFTTGMKNNWKYLVYVDLFAGPGRCRIRPDGQFIDGSPLIAADYGFTHLALMDISQECIGAVKSRLGDHWRCRDFNVAAFCGDSNQEIGTLIDHLRAIGDQSLGFAFVDPPGIEIEFDTLTKLSESTRLDLILNFPLGMNIKRQFWQRWNADPKLEGGFERYFGTPEWRDCVEAEGGAMEKTWKALTDFYMGRLKSIGYSHVGDLPTVKTHGVPLYNLIFASKNKRGKDFWDKIGQIRPTGQRGLFY